MRIDDLGTAIGDRGEALECEDRQRDRRCEACDREGFRRSGRGLKCEPAGRERRNAEGNNAADFQNRHNDREQTDRAIARDVNKVGENDQPNGEHGHKITIRTQIERSEDVSPEGPRHQALVNHHRERHQQRRRRRDRPRPVGLLQDHRDPAGGWKSVRHFHIGVGAEPGHNSACDEREREPWSCQFRYLSGKREDPRPDHHAGAHRDTADQGNAVRSVFRFHRGLSSTLQSWLVCPL